ncbi:glycosyltransferase family A protein [uncultured Dokdonia sp.]|uniref:glycosyltransferase family 2 protein n=1 Tax=uncultured Dokdonia sp. TaxID=575653 RepID=UPI0030EBFF60|tara:strand:+ start:54430 stop:55290 length:861 start_codon:yes stop_codon:yes gene_type:complete
MSVSVSIIVPCYKQAHFLSETLQSVLNQRYTDWECIIVNDGSPDNTDAIAKDWCLRDRRFKYIYKNNGGLPAARNSGISIAKGKFILPLDSDDILHEDFLSLLVPVLENDKGLEIVSCYRKFFKEEITNIVYEHKPIGTTYHALLYENILMPSSLYRKESWGRVGGYDETMRKGFEDWEFWIALTKNGQTFKIVEQFLFYYRKSETSMLMDTLANHRIAVMQYVFKKHQEVFEKHYDNTLEYMFFLVNLYRNSEIKIKSSTEYKIAGVIGKPLRLLRKLTGSTNNT